MERKINCWGYPLNASLRTGIPIMQNNIPKNTSCISANNTLFTISLALLVIYTAPSYSTNEKKNNNLMLENQITPCPNKPNCVSTKADGKKHYIEPIRYTGSTAAAKARLLTALNNYSRTTIIKNTDRYIHVVFTSLVFRFKDDVEFEFASNEKTIHFKSASRMGYSDLGANRRRCESIRKKFLNSEKSTSP